MAIFGALPSVAVSVARADGYGSDAGGSRELGVAGEGLGAGDLGLERFDRLRELADPAQLVAGDADAHRLLDAREPPRDARAPGALEQRAARQSQLRPEVVQMPLQRVVECDALADEAL